jgi:iron complex outermembrane recepter protein
VNLHRLLLSSAAAIALGSPLLGTNQAHAQQDTPAPETGAENQNGGLDEIVVTARRRAENLQDVPLSVTAFSPEAITRAGIDDRTALADATPSLITITGGFPSEFAFFALRGQGPAFGSTPGVISYFAEVPNTINIDGRVGTYFDLSGVQVLAGPQGTLFGKNATGGNILFEPQRPTDVFEGYVRGELGNYNDQRLDGAINLPLGDRAQLRVAGEAGRRDGYTTDVGPNFNGRDYDNLSYESARVSLLLQPTDALENYTVARYYHSDNNGGGTVPVAFNPAAGALGVLVTDFFPGIVGAVAGQNALGPRQVAYDLDQFSETEYWQIINHTTFDITDNLRIKNIVSYSEFRDIYGYDYDATVFSVAGQGLRGDQPTVASDTFTEELQLQGTVFDGAVNFATGVYYDEQEVPQGGRGFVQFPFHIFLGGPIFAQFNLKTESQAVFGQATVDMGRFTPLDGLSVTAGYRYTWESVDSSTLIVAPPATTGSGEFEYGSYNLTLDYALTDGVHAYIAARNAFKAGGVNAGVPVTSPFNAFPPEELSDVEVGLKSQFHLGDAEVRANLAIFRGDYTNIQRTTTEIIGGVGLNVTRSAAEGRVQGVEFTGAISPFEGFTLSGAYSYIDSEYTSVTDASAGAILAGSPFPFTPQTKFSLTATYERDLGNIGELVFGATYAQQSKFSTAQTNASFIRYIPGYDTLSLSVDLNSVGGSPVDLSLFATNITDNLYATGAADFYNQPFGVATLTYGEPRMYGARVRYRFGS